LRRLLVKLVAIETALVGWLSYWLFLLYANNPSVADQLSSSLQRFPQLSFSTIDIAVMVIIAGLAITLAFKFQRGLRPGIRLERALQMLENLMKRNLVLEAQVAELKIDKAHPTSVITTAPTIAPSPSEPRPGSWEKAFRTPLEAGPPLSARSTGTSHDDVPFGREKGLPPPRIEPVPQTSAPTLPKPTIMITEKGADKPFPPPTIISERTYDRPTMTPPPVQSASSWEDSPKFIGESKGILTPSSPPRKAPQVSESGGLKQPYIPAPAPKIVPSSIIVGPMTTTPQPKTLPRPPHTTASPKPPAPSASPRPSQEITKPSPNIPPLNPSPDKPPTSGDTSPKQDNSVKIESKQDDKTSETTGVKDSAKPSEVTKKKFPYEED
jgi:hypothetical protein